MFALHTLGQRILFGSFLGLLIGIGTVALVALHEIDSQTEEIAGVTARETMAVVAHRAENDLERAAGLLRGLAMALDPTTEEARIEQLLAAGVEQDTSLRALHFIHSEGERTKLLTVCRTEDGSVGRDPTGHEPFLEDPAPIVTITAPDTSFRGTSNSRGLDLVLDLKDRPGTRVAATIDTEAWRTLGDATAVAELGVKWTVQREERALLAVPEGWVPDLSQGWNGLDANGASGISTARSDEGLHLSLPIRTSTDSETQLHALVPAHRLAAHGGGMGLLAGLVALAALTGLGITWLITKPLVARLRRCADRLEDIADGDQDLTIKLELDGRGEIHRLGANFDQFVESIRSLIEGIAETAAALDENTEEIEVKTRALRSHCQVNREAAEKTTGASTDVAMNLASAETEVETMGAHINEISGHIEKSSTYAQRAADVAAENARTIQSLGERSNEIDQFVEVINGISEQTNLLALNATIEAARAGASGKGFAVVANEVKTLAGEAAEASETIRTRIEAIQSEIRQAVKGSESIDNAIQKVNGISHQIAGAMDQQHRVTETITRALREATDSVEAITTSAEVAEHTATLNESEAKMASATAMEVATVSASLRIMIEEFRY